MKKLFALLLVVILPPLCGNWSVFPQTQVAAPPEQTAAQKRREAFDIVWNTVNDRFYDPTFGGVDWNKVHDRFLPQVVAAKSDYEVHRLLQQMIGELHQSHFLIIPKETIPKLLPDKAADGNAADDEDEKLDDFINDESTSPLDRVGYKLTERLSTGIGIDLRVIDGKAVITHVEPRSTGALAGLRAGFVIRAVQGQSMDSAIAAFTRDPALQAVFRGELPLILLASFINGDRRSPVSLSYLDGRSRLRTATVRRERLKGEMSPAIGNLPAMYTEFDSRTLPSGIGYIRFNAFMPILMKKVCAALRSHRNAPGLILDLRGNQGGLLGMVGGLSGLLEKQPVLMGLMQSRSGSAAIMGYPQRLPYSGPLVIMVDGSTQSAAEMFASALQESGRAVVVGQKSAGNTLPSVITKLPTGALFQYAFANFLTAKGQSLEGHGITPDVVVELNRRNLLTSSDPQLAAAVKELRQQISPRKELIADITVDALPGTAAADKAKIRVDSPPPPVAKPAPTRTAPPVRSLVTVDAPASSLPSVSEVISRYMAAVGGPSAFEKVKSRVSRGTVELQAMGLTGTVEIYEEAPAKSTMLIKVDGLGTIQQTYDGTIAFLQDPLDGYIRFPASAAAVYRKDAVFDRQMHFKELNPDLRTVSKEKVGGRDVFVLHGGAMALQPWVFDAETGLLLRKGNSQYEDYREVDGIKLPFKITENVSTGFGLVVHLSEIKHNQPIDPSKFMEIPDCFTQPATDWTKR